MLLRITWRCLELAWYGLRGVLALPFQPELYRGRASIAFGRSIASLFERSGPTFIKLAQVLSSRPDIVPPFLTDPLSRLCEHVRPIPGNRVMRALSEGLGVPPSQIFREIDWSPIACGSISQVHKAHLMNGVVVAVKIRRPDAAAAIKADLFLLRRFAAVLERLPGLRGIPCLLMVNEFGSILENQLDFCQEADNMKRFHAMFASLPMIIIPRGYMEWSTESVLVMEHLSDFSRIGELQLPEEQRHQIARSCVDVLYTMAFEYGLVHADLHPGNVFFRANGEIVVVDFGLVTELKNRDLKSFAEFFFGMVTNDGKQCAQVLYDNALFLAPQFDFDRFEADMVQLIARYASLSAGEFEVSRFAYDLFQTQRRHGLSGSPKFVSVILAFVVLEGIVKQLYPRLTFMAQARAFIPRVMKNMWMTA